VILGQIGEDGDVPFDSAGSFLGQRVRRDLHRGGAATGVDDLREQFLNVERFRRGSNRRQMRSPISYCTVPSSPQRIPALSQMCLMRNVVVVFPIRAGDRGHF